jgi:SEC-C motif domain protein
MVTPSEGSDRCPCGRGEPYPDCCGRLHRGEAAAVTAEQLMRSRYSAFALGDPAYLAASWHRSTRPARVEPDADRRWTRLDILATEAGGLLAAEGTVEFRAHYTDRHGRPGSQHEVSRFVRDAGRWVYLDALR